MANAIAPWIATTIGFFCLFRKKMFHILEQIQAVNMNLCFVTELKKRKLLWTFFDAGASSVTKDKKSMTGGFRKHLLEKNETNAASEHYDEIGYRPISKTFCIFPATVDIITAHIIIALLRCAVINGVLPVETGHGR